MTLPALVCRCGAIEPNELFRLPPDGGSLARCEACGTHSRLMRGPVVIDLRNEEAASTAETVRAIPLGPDDAGWLPAHLSEDGDAYTCSEHDWVDHVLMLGIDTGPGVWSPAAAVLQYGGAFKEWLNDPVAAGEGTSWSEHLDSRLEHDEDGVLQLLPAPHGGAA
jgi:hypothetical protein